MSIQWPKIFDDNSIHESCSDLEVLADGLTGWAICMSGNKPHKNFGTVMMIIGNRLGCMATPDNLNEKYDELMGCE